MSKCCVAGMTPLTRDFTELTTAEQVMQLCRERWQLYSHCNQFLN